MRKSKRNPFDGNTKHPASLGFDEKLEERPIKRQRVFGLEDDLNITQRLDEYANNSKLREEFAQDIYDFLSSMYSGTCSLEEHDKAQKILTPEISSFFEKQKHCMKILQEQIDKACTVLREKSHSNKNPNELLHLLKQECDFSEVEENALIEKKRSLNQQKRALCDSLSTAIRDVALKNMAIKAWCSHKEAFVHYVRTFSSRVFASIDSHRAFLAKPLDPAADDHFLADVFEQSKNGALRSEVIQWEEYVECLFFDRLNANALSFDQSILQHQLSIIQGHWLLVSASFSHEVVDEMSQYLRHAEMVNHYILGKEIVLSMEDRICFAAQAGHVSLTLELFQSIKDDTEEFSVLLPMALGKAVSHGRYALLKALLYAYEPDVHAAKYSERSQLSHSSLLAVAGSAGTSGTVRCILDYLEAQDTILPALQQQENGPCPMVCAAMYAARRADEKICDVLIPYLENNPDYLNVCGPAVHEAPLHSAVKGKNRNIVRRFLALGIDPDVATQEGERPIHVAVENGDLDLVQCLIQTGANINLKDACGYTALMHTVLCDAHPEITKVLVDACANVLQKNNKGETALMLAQKWGHEELVDYLTEVQEGRSVENAAKGVACIHNFFFKKTEFPVLVDHSHNSKSPLVELILSYLGNDFRPSTSSLG